MAPDDTAQPGAGEADRGDIDRGQIRDGEETPPEPISEVELELKSGPPAALYHVALKLLHVAPLRLEPRSKAERGYLLAGDKGNPKSKAVHASRRDTSSSG